MSWLNPNERFRDLLCMLRPRGKTCEDHFKLKYPECFQTQTKLKTLLELPQKAWRHMFPNNECDEGNTAPNTDHCAQLLQADDDSSSAGCILKCMIMIAIGAGILYAIIKVSAQRRASLQ